MSAALTAYEQGVAEFGNHPVLGPLVKAGLRRRYAQVLAQHPLFQGGAGSLSTVSVADFYFSAEGKPLLKGLGQVGLLELLKILYGLGTPMPLCHEGQTLEDTMEVRVVQMSIARLHR